jgi:hypothetical protein
MWWVMWCLCLFAECRRADQSFSEPHNSVCLCAEYLYTECHCLECLYTEWHCVGCLYAVYSVSCFDECYIAESHYAECLYAESHYAMCLCAECFYTECHYTECHYVECHGAVALGSGQCYKQFTTLTSTYYNKKLNVYRMLTFIACAGYHVTWLCYSCNSQS